MAFLFVVLDPRTPPPPDIAAVSAAHLTGARAIMSHLVRLGHRRVGTIAGPRDWLVADARMAGYAAALAEVGVLPQPDPLRHIELSFPRFDGAVFLLPAGGRGE